LLFNLLLHISRRGGCAVDVGAEREPSAQGNANFVLRRNHGVGEIKTQKAAISQAATSVRGNRKEHGTNDLRTCCNSVFLGNETRRSGAQETRATRAFDIFPQCDQRLACAESSRWDCRTNFEKTLKMRPKQLSVFKNPGGELS